MAEPKGFLKYSRKEVEHRPVEQRINDFREILVPLSPDDISLQAGRCMDCGIPFCHSVGCPLGNLMPEFNDLLYKGQWRRACDSLHSTNNFPEITGRVCPAACEAACTLSINDESVLIRQIELQIVENGFEQGWIKPLPAERKSGRKVAIIGSGPAGLAAAQQLARAGHGVVVFEKNERPGGILRYGIPDFKLEKPVINRRLDQLRAEGVEFQTGVNVGTDISFHYLRRMFDCVCLAMGAAEPRNLDVEGRSLKNVVFAMDYLTVQNRLNSSEIAPGQVEVTARDKTVVVIGGGDTGSDCVGTARRQGAGKIYQFEILPKPPLSRPPSTPWPEWPSIMRVSSSHEEGCERRWAVTAKKLTGAENKVRQVHCCEVEWRRSGTGWEIKELGGSDFVVDAELVILAMGFLHVAHDSLVRDIGLKLDKSGNIAADDCQTSEPAVFAAGDAVSGASLVARAVASGRKAAAAIDKWLRAGG